MKKVFKHLIALILILSLNVVTAYSHEGNGFHNKTIVKPLSKPVINLSHVNLSVEPIEIDGITMIPLRDIFEALGATVEWDEKTDSIICTRNTNVKLKINHNRVRINNKDIKLKVQVQKRHGITMVPLELVTDFFGLKIKWHKERHYFEIFEPIPVETSINPKVHFIDVGHGDCIFIDIGDYDILIDAGNNSSGYRIVDYLNDLNTDDIEILVATHPDKNHIGGLDIVMDKFKVKKIIDSGSTSKSEEYIDYLKAVSKETTEEASFYYDKDMKFEITDNISFEIIETLDNSENLNNNSVICKLNAGKTSFLFMGDAEFEAENTLSKTDAECDVIKLANHGLNTSSSISFLSKTEANKAVISCGKDKTNYPHYDTIQSLRALNIDVFRTDRSGTVVMETNGINITTIQEPNQNKSVYDGDIEISIIINNPTSETETVYIRNKSNKDILLTNWTLLSEVGNEKFIFPDIKINANSFIYVCSNQKDYRFRKQFYHWSENDLWNNVYDCAYLIDDNGRLRKNS